MRLGYVAIGALGLALGAPTGPRWPDGLDAATPAKPSIPEPATRAERGDPPAGLTRDDWTQIRHSLEESGYYPASAGRPAETSYLQASNRRQGYRTTFRPEGIDIMSVGTSVSWRLGVSVKAYGYVGALRPVMPAEPQSEKERVEYRRGPLTEWYVNRPAGLEQGFELQEPLPRRAEPLVVAMAVAGPVEVSATGDGLSFIDPLSGATLVRYAGLKAWDARGQPLLARLHAEGRDVRLTLDAQGARFPITVDPTFVHEAHLVGRPDATQPFAQLGGAVSVSGDTLVVGAIADTTAGNQTGAAYVFVRSGTTWTQQQKLVAADASATDWFGASVSVSGDTAVITAVLDDTPAGANAGSAYVFVRTGTTWTEQQHLLASDGAAGDSFGASVSVSGDTAVVGAPYDDMGGGGDQGSAYVFVRSGTAWTQQQKLFAAQPGVGDGFGSGVSISGDTVVAGSPSDDTVGVDTGAAYVFVRAGTTWSLQQKVLALDPGGDDHFGNAVAVAGDTAVVGAVDDNLAGALDAGSAYVFVRAGAVWTQQQKLVAPDAEATDSFGRSVAISGDTAVIGTPSDVTPSGFNAGTAHVFVRSGTAWSQQQKLVASDAAPFDEFGFSVSIQGDTVVAGAPQHDTAAGPDAGSAYVSVRSGAAWTEQQSLYASDSTTSDALGFSVSVAGDTVVVGAPLDDTPAGVNAGSAYVFVRSGTTWTEQQKLLPSDGAAFDQFGYAVAVSGDTVVVGAPFDDTPAADVGSAYVFVRSGTTWSQQQKLTAADAASNDAFGVAVSVSGDTALVGAWWEDNVGGADAGSAYVFIRSGTAWGQQQKLLASDGATFDLFGWSVALSGNTAVVGVHYPFIEARDEPRAAAGLDAGKAYMFVRSGTTWTEQQKLLASDGAVGDAFGYAVSVFGDTVVIGAPLDDTPAGADAGSAYVFVRSGTVWAEQQKLQGSDVAALDNFGTAVGNNTDVAVIGLPGDDTPGGANAGSAYVFVRGAAWTELEKLLAPDAAAGDAFGAAISFSVDTAAAGVRADDTPSGSDAGSAHVFRGSVPVELQSVSVE